MSITSLNFVISQFETENYRYFIIFDEDNDPVYSQNELIDKESAIAKLRNFFKDNNGYYTIKVFSKKLTNPKNRIELDKNLVTKFNVELTSPITTSVPVSNLAVTGLGVLPQDDPRNNAPNIYELFGKMGDVTTQMKLMEKDHAHYREMKDLHDRIAEMERERENSKGMNGVLSTLGENFKDPAVLMGILSSVGGLFKPKADVMAMNGINDEVAENIDLRKQKMVKAVNTLMRLDPSFPENISSLAVLCETKPEMYKLAVNYLNNM
jgi:hypothetical protein